MRAGGGCTWAGFNEATNAYGLATTGGIIGSTGIAGLTLGGGIGYLSRKYGLSCDNLMSAEVVTADGQVVTASENENEDLFWALRGGGGNFGVVTTFEYRLHPVAEVYGGPIAYPVDRADEVLRFYREYIADAPEELGGFVGFHLAPPLPFLPEEWHFKNVCLAVPCWAGPLDQGEKMIKPFLDVVEPVGSFVGPMPYPALNTLFDPLLPAGLQHYWKASFARELSDDAIAVHQDHGARVPAIQCAVHLYPINGAVQRVGCGRDRVRVPRRQLLARHRRHVGRPRRQRRRTSPGSAATTRRSSPTRPRAATSTSWTATTRAASRPTIEATTNAWPRSRTRTTPPTCSTSTRTSNPACKPEQAPRRVRKQPRWDRITVGR